MCLRTKEVEQPSNLSATRAHIVTACLQGHEATINPELQACAFVRICPGALPICRSHCLVKLLQQCGSGHSCQTAQQVLNVKAVHHAK